MLSMKQQTALKTFRQEFTLPRVSQEDMARTCGVTLVTYRKVENGGNTSFTTARAILVSVNHYRTLHSMETLNLDDLGLNIV